MPSSRASRAYRVLRAVPIAVFALALLYVVGANVLLRTRLLRNALSGDPDKMLVEYDDAWSIVPGRVHAKNLRVRGKDSSVEWLLTIGDLDFRVAVTELASKRLHATHVRGRDVAFRLRRRVEAADAKAIAALLPPIEGLEEIPIKPPPQPPPSPEELAKLWAVQLDDVEAGNLRELWIDAYRLTGTSHVTGAFYLRPLQSVWVGPASMELAQGRVTLGPKEPIATNVDAGLSVTVEKFDPREVHGKEVLRWISAHVALDADVPTLALVRHLLRDAPIDLRGTGGRARVDLGIERGAIVDGGRAAITGAHVELAAAGQSIDARASANVTTSRGLDWEVRAEPLAVAPIGHESTPLEAKRAVARGRLAPADLAGNVEVTRVEVDVPSADCDSRVVNAFERAVPVEAGRGTVGGKLEIRGREARGEATVGASGAMVRYRGLRISGDVVATARGERRGSKIHFDPSHVVLRHVRADASSGPDTPPEWWGDVTITNAILALAPATELRLAIESRMRDARPLLALLVANATLPAWASHISSLEDFRVKANAALASDHVDLRDIDAQGGGFAIRGSFLERGEQKHAVALIEKGILSVGVEVADGHTSLVTDRAVEWYQARAARPVIPRRAARSP